MPSISRTAASMNGIMRARIAASSGEMRDTLPQRNSSSMRSPITSTRWPANRAMREASAGIAGGLAAGQHWRALGGRGLARHHEKRESRPRHREIEPAPEPNALIEDL